MAQVNLAPQVLLNCGNAGSCNGGDPLGAYRYINQNGITDETCAVYQAEDLDCSDINVCRNCQPGQGCFAQTNFTTYYVDEYGPVSGEKEMMSEIFARGPISCGVSVTDEFEAYKGGVFKDTTGAKGINHEISVTGWGVDTDGTPFWVVRNSWGTYWGEQGWARVFRGDNNIGIESACSFGVPRKVW